MKNFKYKTSYSSVIRCLIDEEKDKILAKASLDNLKSIIPEEVRNQLTLLPIAFNSCTANLGNKNGAVIGTKTALEIYKQFINLPVNLEHSREASYGHIVNASFSEFDINYAVGSGSKILDTASIKDTNEPFNLALAAVLYKLYIPQLCEAIEESNDPNSSKYLDISASWELLYDEYDLAVGSKYLKDCEIISDANKLEEYDKYLLHNGGAGKLPDGKPIFVLLKGEVIPGGIGLTATPAAEVKGVYVDSEKRKIEVKSSESNINVILDSHASGHFINKCSCGHVISQCRCAGNKTETIISNGCEKCKNLQKNEKSNSQSKISSVKANNDINKSSKNMIKTLKDLNDEVLKEATASEIIKAHKIDLDAEVEQISKKFVEDKSKVENELKASNDKIEDLDKKYKSEQEKVAKIQEDLNKLIKANQDREQEEIFNTRMNYFDQEYDLSEEKIRNIVARKIKGVDEQAYTEAKEEIELLLAAKKKSNKVFDKKSGKWVDKEEMKEEKKEESKASVEKTEDVTATVVDNAIDNGTKTTATVAATTTVTETLTEKWNKAFGEDGWEVDKRSFRK